MCYIDEFNVFNLPSLYTKLTQLLNPALHFVKRENYTIAFTIFLRITIKTKRKLLTNKLLGYFHSVLSGGGGPFLVMYCFSSLRMVSEEKARILRTEVIKLNLTKHLIMVVNL